MMKFEFKGDAETGLSVSPHFFELADGAAFIRLDSRMPEGCVLQWYLYNPSGILQGQSFCISSGRTTVIAPGNTVPFGASGSPLTAGRWTLWVICVYGGEKGRQESGWTLEITCGAGGAALQEDAPGYLWLEPDGKVSPAYSQKVFNPARGWYRGDFHVHTTCSDGKMPPSRIKREAENGKLDFFAITDHNFFHTGWVDDTAPVIPGMELTLPQGHFNLFVPESLPLLRESVWSGMTGMTELPETFLQKCREAGAVISVNHPFMPPWEVRDPDLDVSLFDAMEVICDPTWNTSAASTEKALKAFGILWDRGLKVTGIGGSDIHNPPEEPYEDSDIPGLIGLPSTWALAAELSVKALIEAVARHRVCVATGFRLEVSARCGEGDYAPGSLLPLTGGGGRISICVCLGDTSGEYRAELVEDGAVKETASAANGRPVCFERLWDGGYHWLRVDIRGADGKLCGFSNPFYAGEKRIEKLTWGELVELVG